MVEKLEGLGHETVAMDLPCDDPSAGWNGDTRPTRRSLLPCWRSSSPAETRCHRTENSEGVEMASMDPQTGYASVNGIELYYEVHGAGEPLVLLHGGVGASEMFGANLPELARSKQVIAVHLLAHAHTADIDRPMTYEAMADDVASLIGHLGFERADVMGYSLGGGVSLQTAIRHPEVVRKLVLVSAAFKREGCWYPEVLA